MADHSKYSPSRLARIIACPGSVGQCREVEQKSSSYAQEGSMLHTAIERALDLYKFGDTIPADIMTPSLTAEQRSAVQDCFDYAEKIFKEVLLVAEESDIRIYTEMQVSLADFNIPEVYGTSDLIIVAKDIIHTIDWKFGQGVPVYAEDNEQLRAYTLGAICASVKDTPFGDVALRRFSSINIHVVQPRISNFSRVTETAQSLTKYIESVAQAIVLAESKHPPLCAGEKQCRWCDAKMLCKEHKILVDKIAGQVFATHAKLPNQVSTEEVVEVLKQAPILEAYLKELNTWALRELSRGREVPGYKLVAGRSTRRWANEEQAVQFLLDRGLDVDDIYTQPKFIGPSPAEKLMSLQIRKSEEFQALIVKPEGKPTLAKEDDKRPALKTQSAEEVFSNYTN